MSLHNITKLHSSYFFSVIKNHIISYPTQPQLNYKWSFGSLLGIFYLIQVLTGIFLAMHYMPHVDYAFTSVDRIVVDVNDGWFFRFAHANGASFIFILMYGHMARGIYYRGYRYDRRFVWWSGLVIFILMMGAGFIGYVLPWGQMSFWGATVITNLLTTIPYIGEPIAIWIWGGYSIDNATLNRFFSFHYIIPMIIFAVILLHLILLHKIGSSGPTTTATSEHIPFSPYYIVKDIYILVIWLWLFNYVVCFEPYFMGHPDNYVPADALRTPEHIVPEWYFTPFYAILRACPNKIGGAISMVGALLILFALPFLSELCKRSHTKITLFDSFNFGIFCCSFITLIYVGSQEAAEPYVSMSKLFSTIYFLELLVFIPRVYFFRKED